MKIPIRNLFYLLCYAWDILETTDDVEIASTPGPTDLENLMAHVLAIRLERLLRRGLERDYREKQEDVRYIRGKIDVPETVKRSLLVHGEVHVIADELSADILPNRILKAAVRTLLRFPGLSKNNHERLAGLYRGLRDVSDQHQTASNFQRVRLHGNNRSYVVLLNICEMIYACALPVENGRGMRFADFERDNRLMWKVFQTFVINFYRRKQTKYRLRAEAFSWFDSHSYHEQKITLPRLETDVVLTSSNERIVLDTKFYTEPFEKRYQKPTLTPSHLNQIFAYMQNIAAREQQDRITRGILLYAASSGAFSLDWQLFGMPLRVAGVDLSRPWQDIESQLMRVISQVDTTSSQKAILA